MPRLFSLLRNLFQPDRVERELDDEMQAMLDVLATEYMQDGLSPDEARRAARVSLGIEST